MNAKAAGITPYITPIAGPVHSRIPTRPVPAMATQPGPGAQRSVCPQGDSHFEVSSAGSYAPYPFKIAVMEIKRAPIPISELAMIAIQVRYISLIAPPTHRSLASHIVQDR
jgi:hypothetical protein